jgi:cytochrome P450 family 628
VRPNEFVPERWTTEPELVLRPDAYIPFYTGAYGCAGKQLALMEVLLVMTQLVREFDISFAPQETGEKLVKEMKDHFNVSLEPFYLGFKELH